MKTVFATGPGFFACNTSKTRPEIPKGTMRVYCARIEAYDLSMSDGSADPNTAFRILFSFAEGNRDVALALLTLGECIENNREELEKVLGR